MLRRLGFPLLAIALLAAACSAESSGSVATADATDSESVAAAPSDAESDAASTSDSTTDQTSAADTDDAAPAATVESAGGTPMSASSPIGEFFDGGFDEALTEYRIRVGEAILICMAAQGFEFAVSENARTNPVEERQNELTTREWTSEYGFGISTSFDSIAQNQTSDPNIEIFFSMSESEREIWAFTLSGGDIGDATGGDLTSRPLEDQGCIGQAIIETGGEEAIQGLETFGEVYEEGEASLLDSREMVEAVDAWARCMSLAGFNSFSTMEDPEDDIRERFDVVVAPLSAALDNLSDEEGQALIAGDSFDIEDLPDLDVQALRDLQQAERAVAVVDLDCYEAEVQAIFEPLRDDFERGLLTEYATEFGALKNIGS